MAKFFSFSFFLLFLFSGHAQNLVPNPSFEEFTDCPSTIGQVSNAYPWTQWRESPDYFNACSPGITLSESVIDVPTNGWGFQQAATGYGYMGSWCYGSGQPPFDFREIIGCPLLSPLQIGEIYYVSFKVNPALDGFYTQPGFATNHIGALFTTEEYWWEDNPVPLQNFAHVYSSEIITDTLGWTTISGSFMADQAFSFLGIGNFFLDEESDTLHLNSSGYGAYYYFDDICVSKDSLCYVNSSTHNPEISPVNFYPIPAQDILYVQGKIPVTSIRIFDVSGNVITMINGFDIEKISVTTLTSGVYILESTSGNIKRREKLIVCH